MQRCKAKESGTVRAEGKGGRRPEAPAAASFPPSKTGETCPASVWPMRTSYSLLYILQPATSLSAPMHDHAPPRPRDLCPFTALVTASPASLISDIASPPLRTTEGGRLCQPDNSRRFITAPGRWQVADLRDNVRRYLTHHSGPGHVDSSRSPCLAWPCPALSCPANESGLICFSMHDISLAPWLVRPNERPPTGRDPSDSACSARGQDRGLQTDTDVHRTLLSAYVLSAYVPDVSPKTTPQQDVSPATTNGQGVLRGACWAVSCLPSRSGGESRISHYYRVGWNVHGRAQWLSIDPVSSLRCCLSGARSCLLGTFSSVVVQRKIRRLYDPLSITMGPWPPQPKVPTYLTYMMPP